LLLDYKAELAYMRKDYDVAVKKREKAIHLLENEDDTSLRKHWNIKKNG
jgi:hypothetical protein